MLRMLLLSLLANVILASEIDEIRARWDADADLHAYLAMKLELKKIDAETGGKGDHRNAVFNALADIRDALHLKGTLVNIGAQVPRGPFEKLLAIEPFNDVCLIRPYDFTFMVPDDDRPCTVSLEIPPSLTVQYLSVIRTFIATGDIRKGSAMAAIRSRASDKDVVAYDALKALSRYPWIVPDNSPTDKRTAPDGSAELQEKVFAAIERLERDGKLVSVHIEVPLGRLNAGVSVDALKKAGLEVGWDWNATDVDSMHVTRLSMKVPNGMVGFYVDTVAGIGKHVAAP